MRYSYDVKKVEQMIREGIPMGQIAILFNITRGAVEGVARKSGIKRPNMRRYAKPASIPTPEEIEARAAEVRSRWHDEERKRRCMIPASVSWSAPQVNIG